MHECGIFSQGLTHNTWAMRAKVTRVAALLCTAEKTQERSASKLLAKRMEESLMQVRCTHKRKQMINKESKLYREMEENSGLGLRKVS